MSHEGFGGGGGGGGGGGDATGAAIIGGLIGVAGAAFQKTVATKFRRRQRAAIQEARVFADATVKRITSSKLFKSAQKFISSTFDNAATSPLAQDFGKRIRAAQSVRGTFTGNIGAAQEAIGVSGFAQNLRRSLLAPALEFATAPERIRQSVLAQESVLRVASATGAPIGGLQPGGNLGGDAFGAVVSGAAAGFQLQQQFAQSQHFNEQLRQLQSAQAERQGFSTQGQQIAEDDNAIQRRIQELSGTV